VPNASGNPDSITLGPDGNLWFVAGLIARVTPAGVVSEFPADAAYIARIADGNLWFTGLYSGLGRITPAGAVTSFINAGGRALTGGSDGNIWVLTRNSVLRYSP